MLIYGINASLAATVDTSASKLNSKRLVSSRSVQYCVVENMNLLICANRHNAFLASLAAVNNVAKVKLQIALFIAYKQSRTNISSRGGQKAPRGSNIVVASWALVRVLRQ